ncbi:hypothetical protein CH380_15985 [Leptospira adleri]|uniref:Uncharacterized protein n=1 Tax=Leptospira adleri TaxID=2023186 RepID=A0A2M9YKU4_9LEPT|nr:hypothetical protein CH380_15985 [Leptospira adleri]PJZ63245.1 hypothetical protein CH376_04255 [Leptospira adleri]
MRKFLSVEGERRDLKFLRTGSDLNRNSYLIMSIENARSELKIFVDSCFGSMLGKVRFLCVGLCGCESPFPERNQGLFIFQILI